MLISLNDIIKRDLLILRYLMVIHYRVGASVYSRRIGHWEMDSDLIGETEVIQNSIEKPKLFRIRLN